MKTSVLRFLLATILLFCNAKAYTQDKSLKQYTMKQEEIGKSMNSDKHPDMCAKLPMQSDGIVRLSKVELYPDPTALSVCQKSSSIRNMQKNT